MKLSIIIPIYNSKDFVENTISSILATTKSDFELILIDDCSQLPTRKFIKSIQSGDITIKKAFNSQHRWTNYNWNLGVKLATGDYIAILNSDILLSDGWDVELIYELYSSTIACPLTIKKNEQKKFVQALHPLVRKVDRKMICGAAFMFKAKDVDLLFPIPDTIKHWCGDNWIADRANQLWGVKFAKKAYIKHSLSASAATLDPVEYKKRILQDLEEYEKLSGRDMKLIKDTIHL